MEEEFDIEKLKNISERLRQINSKFRLLTLLKNAKEEYDKNNYEECITNCLEALEHDPENPVALRGMGCSMQFLGNRDEALRYYNLALKFSKNKEIEYTLIGALYYIEDDLDKALEYFNLAIDENDDYDPAYEGKNQTMLENHLKIIDLQDSLIKRELM